MPCFNNWCRRKEAEWVIHMEYPLISVIVPVYKVEQYLPKCVASLQAQDYPNIEILLVDDGSPDTCGEMCDGFAASDSRIRAIHKINGGLGSARNAGIENARGEYLSFIDSDDWIDSDSYTKLFGLICKYGAQMAFAGRYDYYEATGYEKQGLCPQTEEAVSGEEAARRIFTWNHVDTAAWDKLYHRSLFETLRYPERVTQEDFPVTYRTALLCKTCAMGSFSFYHYRHRAGSITQSPFSRRDFGQLRAAQAIVPYISENHPSLKPAADYLLGHSLCWTAQSIAVADEATREEFKQDYPELCRQLRRQLPLILRNPYFSSVQKRDCVLLAFGLYRLPRTIYHFFKKS